MKKMTINRLRRIISEEIDTILDNDRPEDVEAVEDAWSGGDNLELDLDHPSTAEAEPNVTSIEILSIVDDSGVYRMSENNLRALLRNIILQS